MLIAADLTERYNEARHDRVGWERATRRTTAPVIRFCTDEDAVTLALEEYSRMPVYWLRAETESGRTGA